MSDIKNPLYQIIYHDLLVRINSGDYKSGDKLPSEKQLAIKYSCSRITAQRAINMLMQEKYVTRRVGSGTYIQDRISAKSETNTVKSAYSTTTTPQGENHIAVKRLGFIYDRPATGHDSDVCISFINRARERGYDVFVKYTNNRSDYEAEAIETLKGVDVCGFLIIPTMDMYYSNELLKTVIDGYKIVTINRTFKGILTSMVSTDHRNAISQLVDCLIENGKKSIAYIGNTYQNSTGIMDRQNGFVEKMSLLGNHSPLIGYINNQDDEVAEIMRFLEIHHSIDAVITYNPDAALNAQHAVNALNRNISVGTLDNPIKHLEQNEFTYLKQPSKKIGEAAANLLINQIESNDSSIERILIPGKIIKSINI